ncbi:hypothetical protein DAPPUDRAFT_269554 [Daphnia pulex]|uniref:Uncharacterized protein n=1 Tax=Daphnia pulex TaxID=6669 RepID=E9HZG5_DAPPU|nr:hypothetical protein DAPPUDRAFT_269554 [Daphnia pulex]|eukprot:EFX62865.1 hypothetical protein DAPPUDRAFT_269554 [Daphnia pulex]
MAQSLIPALTSIDEEEEILSDLKSITDLYLLKRLRTSGKMVHTKTGKKLMESIAAKEDRDTVRALRAVYVRDFDLLEKRHDRYVQCKASNYSQDDLEAKWNPLQLKKIVTPFELSVPSTSVISTSWRSVTTATFSAKLLTTRRTILM